MKIKKILSIVMVVALMFGAFSVCSYAEENQFIEYRLTVNGENYGYSAVLMELDEALEIEIADVQVNGEPVDQSKISYKWEKSSPAPEGRPGLIFVELDGENQCAYTTAAYDGTQRYRCTVTVDGVGYRSKEIWLEQDTLSVVGQSNKPLVFSDEEESYFINDLQIGEEITLTINANTTITGGVITYKWIGINAYIEPDSELEESFEIENDTNTLTVIKNIGEQSYFCEISDGNRKEYVHFTLTSKDTMTDDIWANGEHPGTYAGTYIYVTKPNTGVTISIPSVSTKGTVGYKWYYDTEDSLAPVRLDNTTDTITVTKTGFTENNPYAWEVYQCYLEDGNERVRYWIMLFCLDPEKPLSEIQKIGEETPEIEIKTQNEDLANTVLNGDELKALSQGAPIEVTLSAELKQTVSQAEKNAIEGTLTDNSSVGMYLDINLFKDFAGDASQLSELSKSIEISVDMPEDLIHTKGGVERKFSVVRVHNGVAETIPCRYDKTTNKIEFGSDKFSTYTIVYTDTVANTSTDNTLENTENKTPEKETQTTDKNETAPTDKPATKPAVPQTGDGAPLWLFITLMGMSATALLSIVLFRKKEQQ
jgi:hypothetical protein